MSKGKLFLIPTPISVLSADSMASYHAPYIAEINHYIVEEIKTARRYIKKVMKDKNIDECTFTLLDKHDHYKADTSYQSLIGEGHNIGIMSEAGTPCIADPGHTIVMWAQQHDIEIVPLIGPSAIIMALMASGLQGQSFSFNGYLPIPNHEKKEVLHHIISQIQRYGYTQLLIETPYRNNSLLDFLIQNIPQDLALCLAQDVTGSEQYIKTKRISEWRKSKTDLKKVPTIFIIGKL